MASLLGAAAALIAAVSLLASDTAVAGDRDCSDFDNQREAQRFFDSHNPSQDPHDLDADGDGVACESLPCPCSGGSGGGGGGGSGDLTRQARVREVVDGDTVKVRFDGRRRTVRLIGIDTPEVFFGEECGGRQASRSMHRSLDRGERVKLVRDPTQDARDRYGRLLRYIEDGGTDVGRVQVRRGWAKVYVFEDPFRRLAKYRRSQRPARNADRGVWGLCGGDFHKPL